MGLYCSFAATDEGRLTFRGILMIHKGKDWLPKNTVEYFDSIQEAWQVGQQYRKEAGGMYDASWNGGVASPADVDRLSREGWKQGAAKIQPYFDAAQLATMRTAGTQTKLDYVGFMPCVPS